MDRAKFVIAGGGMVAGYAAKQMVEMGLKAGDLAILSSDSFVPYERPPLSKSFLAGRDTEDSIKISPDDFYKQHGIEMRLRCQIAGIDPGRKQISLGSGESFGFEKLVVATGARPRRLKVPGGQMDHVFYLRSIDDSKAIRNQAGQAKRAVVLGGGFIGMETTAVLAQKGVETTMVLRENRIWERFFTPQMSKFFEDYYAARGVRFIKKAELAEVRADGVKLGDGRTVACEMIVAGIGVEPVTDLLAGSGIETGNGVTVNEYLETNQPGVYAAGDVANYRDVLFGKRRRVEHWDNAVSQGQHCARTLMGDRAGFRHVPYFFSDVFDLSYEFWGDPEGADRTIHRGDVSTSSFSVWWVKGDVLVAAFTMNRPDEEREAAPKWIESKQRLSAAKLESGAMAEVTV